jgi:hypothetical protein
VTTFEERKAEIEAEYEAALEAIARMESERWEKRKAALIEAINQCREPNEAIEMLQSGLRIYGIDYTENERRLARRDGSEFDIHLTAKQAWDLELALDVDFIECVETDEGIYDYAYVLTETGKQYAAGADAKS